MSKYFLVNPDQNNLSRTDILTIEKERVEGIDKRESTLENVAESLLKQDDNLKRIDGRVVIKINTESKNYHTFENGEKIRIERRFNNLNRRQTESCNAYVIDADNIPKGTEVLVYYNSIHDSNKIFNYKDESPYIGYYSIKEEDCYLYRDGNEWKPFAPYATALRVFEPYTGTIENVKPKPFKDMLYVTSGELKGQVVKTLKGCDLQVVFQDIDGKEGNIIVFRPFGYERLNLEEEAIAVLNSYTDEVNGGKLLIGLTPGDAKTLKRWHKIQY